MLRRVGRQGSTDHATETDINFFFFLSFFFLCLVFTFPQCRAYTTRDLEPKCRLHGGTTDYGPEHYTCTQGWTSLNLWSYVRASARDKAKQNRTQRTNSGSIEFEILHPAGNWTRAVGLEGRDSTDHATATDVRFLNNIHDSFPTQGQVEG